MCTTSQEKQTPQLQYHESLNLAPKSLFSGYLNLMCYGECVLDMEVSSAVMTKAAGSLEVSVHMYHYMASHPKRQQSWSLL